MKKSKLGAILICLVILGTIGCGGSGVKIPEGMSKEAYDFGTQAIEVTQGYIDGDTTAASAYQQLTELYDESEKLLSKDSETYLDDSMVNLYILYMANSVGEDNSMGALDDIEGMKDALTPIESVDNIADVIVGEWKFCHDTGWTLVYEFNTNGTGSSDNYDDKGEHQGTVEFEYEIDENVKEITISTTATTYTLKNITNKSMDYTMNSVGVSGITGTAYKQ